MSKKINFNSKKIDKNIFKPQTTKKLMRTRFKMREQKMLIKYYYNGQNEVRETSIYYYIVQRVKCPFCPKKRYVNTANFMRHLQTRHRITDFAIEVER